MARTPSTDIEFTQDSTAAVLSAMAELQQAQLGWINFSPEVDEDYVMPPRTLVSRIFSSRGEAVPLATWKPPMAGETKTTIGIEHGAGPSALDRLEADGHPRLDTWFKIADHPRRGLVLSLPSDSSNTFVLNWLLVAADILSVVPLTGHWQATVYRP